MKGGIMKKILVVLALSVLCTSTSLVEAKTMTSNDIAPIGFRILQSNNIQKRMVFKTTSAIKNPRAALDYKPESISLDYTGRVLWVHGDALNLADDENELAGLLSYGVALGEDSYKGMFRGFFSPASYAINSKMKENNADKRAVDYMAHAGYNPIGLITYYNKTLAQTRYEWCHYYPLATKRMMNIYEYIYKNYPQYLKNNVYEDNIYYQNFLANTQKEMCKFEKKLNK